MKNKLYVAFCTFILVPVLSCILFMAASSLLPTNPATPAANDNAKAVARYQYQLAHGAVGPESGPIPNAATLSHPSGPNHTDLNPYPNIHWAANGIKLVLLVLGSIWCLMVLPVVADGWKRFMVPASLMGFSMLIIPAVNLLIQSHSLNTIKL